MVWLPIDAKFPQEDYQRLLDAVEAADREQAETKMPTSMRISISEGVGISIEYPDPEEPVCSELACRVDARSVPSY